MQGQNSGKMVLFRYKVPKGGRWGGWGPHKVCAESVDQWLDPQVWDWHSFGAACTVNDGSHMETA